MKMTFRWFGNSDPVQLPYIRQIPGMYGIVSAIYDVPVGEVWPLHALQALRDQIEAAGLKFGHLEQPQKNSNKAHSNGIEPHHAS